MSVNNAIYTDIFETYRKESYPHSSYENYMKYIRARDEMQQSKMKKVGLWMWIDPKEA